MSLVSSSAAISCTNADAPGARGHGIRQGALDVRLLPELVLTPNGWEAARAVAITDGRIAAVQAAGAAQRGDVALPGRALVPGTINSHCHTFQSLLRGLGDDLDFMGWRDSVLYTFSERLDSDA